MSDDVNGKIPQFKKKNELVVIFKHAECLNMSINIIVFRQVKITFSSFTKDLTSLP